MAFFIVLGPPLLVVLSPNATPEGCQKQVLIALQHRSGLAVESEYSVGQFTDLLHTIDLVF